MVILPIFPEARLLAQIQRFASHLTWQNTASAVNALEATFYASLPGGAKHPSTCITCIRETLMAQIHKIQALFNLANLGFAALSAKELFCNFSIAKDGNALWALKATGITSAVALSVLVGLMVFTQKNDAGRRNAAIDLDKKFTVARFLRMSNLVLNLANACFAKNRVAPVISVASLCYTLWKNNQLKCTRFA